MMHGFYFAHLLWVGVWILLILPPFWTIFAKAGFSPWLSLLMLVPLVNLVVLYMVAFSRWPAQGRQRDL